MTLFINVCIAVERHLEIMAFRQSAIEEKCKNKRGLTMGEEVNIEKIECYKDCYQLDMRNTKTGKGIRTFIRKDALLALIAVAEKEEIDAKDL